jgi:hypothetical protein
MTVMPGMKISLSASPAMTGVIPTVSGVVLCCTWMMPTIQRMTRARKNRFAMTAIPVLWCRGGFRITTTSLTLSFTEREAGTWE